MRKRDFARVNEDQWVSGAGYADSMRAGGNETAIGGKKGSRGGF